MKKYDSILDTLEHIKEVQKLILLFCTKLQERGIMHDQSKLRTPEKELFDLYTPKLWNTSYGSDEYKENMQALAPALTHHYKHNRHHPEHFDNGIHDMNLLDIVEMFLDWIAAVKKHKDGNAYASIATNKHRFNIDNQLTHIFINTVNELK